ncbi:MAG: dTMP kinase [Acidimicrobiales bacterium]
MARRVHHRRRRHPGHPHVAPERRGDSHLSTRGRLIVFEGGEGTGKSTQAALLAAELGALLTREPGGTALGRLVRSMVLDVGSGTLDPRAEALLLLADRAQHVAEVVCPALEKGTDVVSDRFSGSTLAYQGWGRGLDVDWLAQLAEWASGGIEPDLVILLDVGIGVAAGRVSGEADRMEMAGVAFHERVRDGYQALAAADHRWVVVDGAGPVEVVTRRVRAAFDRWDSWTRSPGSG